MTTASTTALLRRARAALAAGETLNVFLDREGLGHARWYRLCADAGDKVHFPQGGSGTTFARTVLIEVRKRVKAGESVTSVATDLGLDYPGLCRKFRKLGTPLLSAAERTKRIVAATRKVGQSRRGKSKGLPGTRIMDRVESLIERGLDVPEITKKLGIRPNHVYAIKSRLKDKSSRQRRAKLRTLWQRYLLLKRDRLPNAELGKLLGVSATRVAMLRRAETIQATKVASKPKTASKPKAASKSKNNKKA